MANKENQDGVAILVDAPAHARTIRVNIALPEDVLCKIDSYARLTGYARSGFLALAAKRAMAA
jgi:hypothetical protein